MTSPPKVAILGPLCFGSKFTSWYRTQILKSGRICQMAFMPSHENKLVHLFASAAQDDAPAIACGSHHQTFESLLGYCVFSLLQCFSFYSGKYKVQVP